MSTQRQQWDVSLNKKLHAFCCCYCWCSYAPFCVVRLFDCFFSFPFKCDAFVIWRCVSALALAHFVSRCIHLYNLVSQIHDAVRVNRQHMDLSLWCQESILIISMEWKMPFICNNNFSRVHVLSLSLASYILFFLIEFQATGMFTQMSKCHSHFLDLSFSHSFTHTGRHAHTARTHARTHINTLIILFLHPPSFDSSTKMLN